MGLLGGGNDDSLSASSGWGVLPPNSSSNDWGSSSSSSALSGVHNNNSASSINNSSTTGGTSSSSSTTGVSAGASTNHWMSNTNPNSSIGASGGGNSRSAAIAVASSSSSAAAASSSSSANNVGTNSALNADSHQTNANQSTMLLSSSPKPSSSWAQAAGKGLNTNGPSHDSGSSGSAAGPSMSSTSSSSYSNVVLPSSAGGSSSSNHHASNSGNGNNSSNNSIFQSSSNTSNQFGGASAAGSAGGGSSSAGGNFQVDSISLKARNNSSNNISDMIGQLSDDLRETLLTEKWGGSTVINQDSPWNLPPSPQSSPKDSSTWPCPANSGTEIWENAVRQKKQGSSISNQMSANSCGRHNNPQMSSAAAGGAGGSAQPWGNAPTSHIGGTWGEDDDSSNHWTGAPPSLSNNSNNSIGLDRLGGAPGAGHNSSSINNWSASNGAIGNILNNSNNNNAHGGGGGLMSTNNTSSQNNNFLNSHHSHNHAPQAHHHINAMNNSASNNNWNQGDNQGVGSHLGNGSGPNTAPVIMGNNNQNVIGNKGAYDSRSGSMSSQSIKPPSSWAANYNDHADSGAPISDPSFENFGTWNSDSGMMNKPKSEPGWDKESGDGKGGPMVDDGTAVWGNPVRQPKSVSNWKDQSKPGNNNQANKIGFANWNSNGGNGPNNGQMSANGQNCNQNQMNKAGGQQQQQQQQSLQGPPQQQPQPQQQQSNQLLSRTWTDVAPNHRKSPSLWNDDTKSLNGMKSAGAGSMTPNNCSNGFGGGPGGSGGGGHVGNNWSDGQVDTSSWGGMKHGKPISREMILSSKQFRILADMNFKKDDVETCLRNNQMRTEDALYELSNMYDDRFKPPNQMNNSALVGNGNQNNSGSNNNKMQPNNQRSMINAQSNPSQIQNLYQRIQTAVNAGYLNPQILNQQLSNQNLEIIYELLQHINRLQTAQTQVANNGGNAAPHQLKHISQVKQSIVQLQNQLQMHNQNAHGGANMNNNSIGQFGLGVGNNNGNNPQKSSSIHSQQPNDFFKSNNDSLYAAGGLNDFGGGQGSRLQSWKQSFNTGNSKSQEDKFGGGGNDFIRAPGPISKQHSSSASLGGGSNWSNFMSDDSGWPSANDHLSSMHHQSKHEKDLAAQSIAMDNEYSLTDSFRIQDYNESSGYKTWKSSGTPGLIPSGKGGVLLDDDARSLNSMSSLKDPMFSWNNSGAAAPGAKNSSNLLHNSNSAVVPGVGAANSVDPFGFNSTWSYSQAPQNSQLFNSSGVVGGVSGDLVVKKPSQKSTWGNQLSGSDSYPLNPDSLWSGGGVGAVGNNSGSVSTISKPRPPPGLSQQVNSSQNKPGSGNGNGSSSNVTNNSNNVANSSIWSNSGLSAASAASSSNSEYLRLRNLTPQIDGSTLKTLCFQHGPLHLFQHFINHGIALVRYANRDQAIKAQSALNNCVLSNITIMADIPSESEVQQYLQLIGNQAVGGNNNNQSLSSSSSSVAINSSAVQSHSQSQSQQSHPHHPHPHHLSSWSNGTNASQSSAGAAGSGAQSASSLYRNNNQSASAGGSGGNGLSFGGGSQQGANNGLQSNPTTSPASTLPYGSVAGSVLTIAHSSSASSSQSTLPYNNNNNPNNNQSQTNSHNNSNHHSSVGGAVGNGWNTAPTGANSVWEMQNSNSANYWSTSGFSSQDRNTPVSNFLPPDLLAGDNN